MKSLSLLLVLVVLVDCILPPNFKKCNRKKPDFPKCLVDAADDALGQLTKPYKEVNLPSLEPFEVPLLSVRGGQGIVSMDQNFKNCQFFGTSKGKFNKLDIDFDQHTVDVDSTVPELTVYCEYDLDGKILLMEVKSHGNSTIIFYNFHLVGHGEFDSVKRGNKTYIQLTRSSLESDAEQIHIQFDNLFDGIKELGDNLNKVFNEHSLEIYQDLKSDYNFLMNEVFTSIMNRFFGKVSQEEAFD